VSAIGTHGEGSDWGRVDGRLARLAAYANERATSLTKAFPNYRDLADLNPKNTDKQKLAFAIEVVVADTKIPTSDSALKAKAVMVDGTRISLDPQYVDGAKGVYGLAEACVTFQRPTGQDRKDGGTERPSLFNPYWRASLATPSMFTRFVAAFAKELPAVDALVAGAGSCA
jgi:hypothetical protein